MSEKRGMYTLTQAAEVFGVSRTQLYNLVKCGVLPSVTYGNTIYIDASIEDLVPFTNPKISDMVDHLFSYTKHCVRYLTDDEKKSLIALISGKETSGDIKKKKKKRQGDLTFRL